MKNGKSLVEKAKEFRNPQLTEARYSDEEVELALAWASDEITITQVGHVRGCAPSSTYTFLACALRQWMNEGKK